MFTAHCSLEAMQWPLLPWLEQLSQRQRDRLYDAVAMYVSYGWQDSTDKLLVPLLRALLQYERPDLVADPEFLDEDAIWDAIMNLNSTLCVFFGTLPAREGEVVYLTPTVFPTRHRLM